MKWTSVLTALLAAMLFSFPGSAAILYDLEAAWSFAANPNGAWSYRVGTTPLGYVQADWGGLTGSTFWATTAVGTIPPAWGQVGPGNVLLAADVGDIVGHSSTDPDPLGNVLWTSPGAGVIDISGQAWDAMHCCGRDDGWSVYVNDVLVAARSGTAGVGKSTASAFFINNLMPLQSLSGWAVNPGDTVMFQIATTTGIGHLVGVDLSINYTPAEIVIPEPAPPLLTLAGLALIGLSARRRRSTR